MSQALDALIKTVATLRSPGGCPWDIEQTHQSIRDCLVEECSELLDTIDRLDMEHMCEELGDLLLHVVMHARMAEEEGEFDFEKVARGINEKLIRRHPHVFGEESLTTTGAVLKKWEEIKAAEKKNGPTQEGRFKPIPPALSALLTAREVIKQMERMDVLDTAIDVARVQAEADELSMEEAGRRLFESVAACRQAGIDPESALRVYTTDRIRDVENHAQKTSV